MADINPTGTVGGAYPKIKAIRKNPDSNSVISKLVGSTQGEARNRAQSQMGRGGGTLLQQVSDATTRGINDNDNIMQLLPDTEIAAQVLISCILSPKDMINIELGYRVPGKRLPSTLSGPMLDVVRDFFDETYNIKSLLPTILEECLFTKGSYPVLTIPESSIDDLINTDQTVSVESLKGGFNSDGQPVGSVGVLGAPDGRQRQAGLESLADGASLSLTENQCRLNYRDGAGSVDAKLGELLPGSIRVTDNLDTLKTSALRAKTRQQNINQSYSSRRPSMEAKSLVRSTPKTKQRESDTRFASRIYPTRRFQQHPMFSLKTTTQIEQSTRGHPLTIKLPPESIIPVHVPSNPEEHVGYFVLLDQFGNPLKRTHRKDYYDQLSQGLQEADIGSQLLSSTQRGMMGVNQASRERTISQAESVQLYASIVEKDLVNRLKNGAYGDNVEIARPMDVYRVMMSRALSNMGTQVLYVPAELVTYFAFDYTEFGVGKSLLEDNKILASIRAVLMFSNTMAAIKNSTTKTNLNIQLDEKDVDPQGTVDFLTTQYMQNNRRGLPIGTNDPTEITDWLREAGVSVEVSGNTAYPETKLEAEERQPSRTPIDRDLDEEMKNRYFMKLGITPEIIDATKDVEFATSVVTSNLLLAKRVMLYQGPLLRHVKDLESTYIYNSSNLYEELTDIVKNNRSEIEDEDVKKLEDEQIVDLFLELYEVTLPNPDSAKIESQMTQLDNYRRLLETAVNAYINEDMWGIEQISDQAGDIRAFRESVIGYFMREFMQRNNILPGLQQMVTLGDNEKPLLSIDDAAGEHFDVFAKGIQETIKQMQEAREKRDAKAASTGANSDNNTAVGGPGGDTGTGDDDSDSPAFGGGFSI